MQTHMYIVRTHTEMIFLQDFKTEKSYCKLEQQLQDMILQK